MNELNEAEHEKDEHASPKIITLDMVATGEHLPYGSFVGYNYPSNFRDASIRWLPFGSNALELQWLRTFVDSYNGCKTDYNTPIEEVAKKILKEETSFHVDDYHVIGSAMGARGAIANAVSNFLTADKPLVAYANPNWGFDIIIGGIRGAKRAPLFAFSADSFVKAFEEFPNKKDISSLIIVDPANPLGYRMEKSHIERIEQIARENGIVPIFDDVFRGLQKKGERHSSSEYSHESIIIETTSKRFGLRGIGSTWTLVPKTLGQNKDSYLQIPCKGCSSLAALVTDGLFSTDYSTKVNQELTNSSRAFKQGFNDVTERMDGGEFVEAFEGMPIFNYVLPVKHIAAIGEFCDEITQEIGITSGIDWICYGENPERKVTKKEARLALTYFRICPTKESTDRSYLYGRKFGDLIKEALEF